LHSKFIYQYDIDTRSAQEPGSLSWCCAVMSLQFTHIRYFAICRGKLEILRADCSTVQLYCVTITWQRIFTCSLQVTVVVVLPHASVERR